MCSNRTETRSILARSKEYHHHYYDCRKHHQGKAGCANNKHLRAKTIESLIWELVSGLLQDPERLREGLEEMIEAERAEMRGDPEQKAKARLDKLAAVDGKRSSFQDMTAKGHIPFEELGAKLRELEETRKMVVSDLATLKRRRTHVEELERDKAVLLEEYAGMIPGVLEELTGV